jgi:hypothetical protein
MAFSFRYLITGYAWVWLALATLAQDQSPTPAPVPKVVSIHFSVFALGGLEGAVYQPETKKPPQPIKFYSAYRSQSYAYKGSTQLQFFDAKARLDEEPHPIAVYEIPEGAKDLLLLFSPKATSGGAGLRYDVYGINDSIEATPAGHFRTINVSGREYAGHGAGMRFPIPQGVGEAHPARGKIALLFATQVAGHWIPAGGHEFVMTPQDRVTLILYPSASRTALYPIVRRLTDNVPEVDH